MVLGTSSDEQHTRGNVHGGGGGAASSGYLGCFWKVFGSGIFAENAGSKWKSNWKLKWNLVCYSGLKG